MSQPRITYDGDPFIITEKHLHDCHDGTDRHAADKQRTKKCLGKREVRIISSVSYWNSSIVKNFHSHLGHLVHKEFSVW